MNHSHDPTSTDDLKLLIRKIIDYSREIGVDIVSMEEALNSMNDY